MNYISILQTKYTKSGILTHFLDLPCIKKNVTMWDLSYSINLLCDQSKIWKFCMTRGHLPIMYNTYMVQWQATVLVCMFYIIWFLVSKKNNKLRSCGFFYIKSYLSFWEKKLKLTKISVFFCVLIYNCNIKKQSILGNLSFLSISKIIGTYKKCHRTWIFVYWY